MSDKRDECNCTKEELEKIEPHTCPYNEEIHNDGREKKLCKCCKHAIYQCERDI